MRRHPRNPGAIFSALTWSVSAWSSGGCCAAWPAPSGGPAFTDILGTCVAWEADHCLIRPDRAPADDAPVRIELGDLVSASPCRPALPRACGGRVRGGAAHRVAVARPRAGAARRVAAAPRAAAVGRARKRANSCLAIGDPGRSVHDALEAVIAFYTARGRDPLLHVEAGSDVESAVLTAGWRRLPHGEAQLAPGRHRAGAPGPRTTPRRRRAGGARHPGVGQHRPPGAIRRPRRRPAWTATGSACSGSPSTRATADVGWAATSWPSCSTGAPSRAP